MILISNIKYKISALRLRSGLMVSIGEPSNIQTKNKKYFWFLVCVFDFWFLIFGFFNYAYAKEITILYTGDTHAMLYHCNCPVEPDGGVARRAALIKELRRENPSTLVLDSGNFFAGGLLDEYTQNTELDKTRTQVALTSMELMRYDAAAISEDEFNFGKDFLLENISKSKLPFLSCNISAAGSERIQPYLIKEIGGMKIGIIGVTNLSAMEKAEGFKFIEPKIALKTAVEELKKKGAVIIIVLSNLGEEEDSQLISGKNSGGIDILIARSGRGSKKEQPSGQVGSLLVFRPSWQGRKLGKVSLTIENNKIKSYKLEELRLSDKIRDDPTILAILPRCFQDANCSKEGFIGTCQNPGTQNSRCQFSRPPKLNLLIVTPRDCRVCDTGTMVKYLEKLFPGLTASYLYYPDRAAKKIVRDCQVKGLPIYLFGKEIEKEKSFANLKDNLDLQGNFYLLKPQASGISYFIDRKRIKGRLDLFISLYEKGSKDLLDAIKDFKPTVHFLAVETKDGFEAAKGTSEVEEYLRCLCVQKHYPKDFWSYITCRAKNINSSWWEDCLPGRQAGLDKAAVEEIRSCAKGEEGRGLLKDNISLNKEIQVLFGPVYLLDNQEAFGTQGVPTKEELRKIFKR